MTKGEKQIVNLNAEDSKYSDRSGSDRHNVIVILICVIIILLILIGAAVAAIINGGGDRFFAKKNKTETEAASKTYVGNRCENLNEIASALNLREGIEAYVENLYGEEYITVLSNGIAISYRNAYSNNKNGTNGHVIINKAGGLKEFDWSYVLEKSLAGELLPYTGDYIGTGKKQLAFTFTDCEHRDSNCLHIVSESDLTEYPVINSMSEIRSLVTVDSFIDGGNYTIALLKANDRIYYVQLDKVSEAYALANYTVSSGYYTCYTVSGNSISLRSFVRISEDGWIGEIRSDVAYSSRKVFSPSALTFYQYAEDDFTDPDVWCPAVPLPLTEANTERVRCTGVNGEKLLVPVRKELSGSTLDASKITVNEHGFRTMEENGNSGSMIGIDVSKWNGDIDWKKVADAGVEFVMIRLGNRTVGDGIINIDPKFESNLKGAKEAGLKVGVYFYTQAVNEREAVEEADFCIENLHGAILDLPVCYDTESYEGARANGISNAQRTKCAKAFCERIKAAGYDPMIYMSTNWSILNIDIEELASYDLWYAYYGTEPYYPYRYSIWQYASDGSVPGISGEVDLDIALVRY